MTAYEEVDGHLVPVFLAEYADRMAFHYRTYPGPSYEERCLQLAQKRAAECKTDAQRWIEQRRPNHPCNTL